MRTGRNSAGLICVLLTALLAEGCDGSRQSKGISEAVPGEAATGRQAAPVAVSSSYLEAALRDVSPEEVSLVRLAGPTMCPGHFDIRPSQISELAQCRLWVRFDFQQVLDEKLGERGSWKTLAVTVPDGMCVPDSYLSACRQIADHFVSAGEMSRSEAEERLSRIAGRMARLRRWTAERIDAAGLRNVPVLASGHQAAFCRWLGLRVPATFSGADTAGAREIDRVVSAGKATGAGILVANEPEGRRLADALADRLQARVVVFANFPEPEKEHAFDRLVRRNLEALLAVVPSNPEKR